MLLSLGDGSMKRAYSVMERRDSGPAQCDKRQGKLQEERRRLENRIARVEVENGARDRTVGVAQYRVHPTGPHRSSQSNATAFAR